MPNRGFIMVEDMYQPNHNNNINQKYQSDITIHGSCVSRDIFNFDKNSEIKLGQYFARQSFISSISPKFIGKVDINLQSPFQRRLVENDLKKGLFKKLSIDKSNYLLIDFMDERLALVKYNESLFTFSDELRDSKFLESRNVEFLDKLTMNGSIWKEAMDIYVNQLLSIYGENKIIIHEAYLLDSYITKNGEMKSFPKENLNYNKKVNRVFKEYYAYLKQKLPNAHVISILKEGYCSSEDHIWGKSPMHYENQYYQDVLEILKEITSSSKDYLNGKGYYNSKSNSMIIKRENMFLKRENELLKRELYAKRKQVAELQPIKGYLKYKIRNIVNRSKKRITLVNSRITATKLKNN